MQITFEPGFSEIVGFPKVARHAIGFPEGGAFDMLNQPRGPRRLTPFEFLAKPVTQAKLALRHKIAALEAVMKTPALEAAGMERLPTGHKKTHIDGVVTCEYSARAGSVIVSKRHAQEHICIVSKGRLLVTVEDGSQEIAAPAQFVSPAGSKRIGLVLEDMVWTTVHRTDKTAPDEIEAELMMDETLILASGAFIEVAR